MKRFSISFDEDDFEDVSIGFLKSIAHLSESEFFFHLNTLNSFTFKRVNDLLIYGQYYTYYHSRYCGFDDYSKSTITFISNKSHHAKLKKEKTELFIDEHNVNFLLDERHTEGFLIKNTPNTDDFSLILFPVPQPHIEVLTLDVSQNIYHLIECYE